MADERIRIGDEYYLLASAVSAAGPRLLLNHGDAFAVFESTGDVPLAAVAEPFGLFYRGTRFLDRFELRLDGGLPVLLTSAPSTDGSELISLLTNADQRRDGQIMRLRDTIALERRKTLVEGVLVERIEIVSFGCDSLAIDVGLTFDGDFADMFELRGIERSRRGRRLEVSRTGSCGLRLPYVGLDGVRRETVIDFATAPLVLTSSSATHAVKLAPGERWAQEIRVECRIGDHATTAVDYGAALARVREERRRWTESVARIETPSADLNDWIARSLADVALLRTEHPDGAYPYAGVPWFATVFGRDGLVTAREMLTFAPELAAGVLRRLASKQGREVDEERDEEPGKVLHEVREGEMAELGEIPFRRYYGSIDSTPLFLVVLAAYAARTGDLALVEQLWPAATRALEWLDDYGDRDGDGYVEYERRGPRGLVNQGWKDSHDSVSSLDGALADPPIALVEVQAYAYAARRGMAKLGRRLGEAARAAQWDAQAEKLRERFELDFWLEDRGIYALALDGAKRPCRVATSNAGHALFGEIASPEHAARVAARLLEPDLSCGFGIRTLSATERRYNPMSYHNGSVWPHDNALVAAGLARYGHTGAAAAIFEAIFAASRTFEGRRLPELYCGFERKAQRGPVPYPVACRPQAWAAGSVFLLLESVLGLVIDGFARRIVFERAHLPEWLPRIEIESLQVGDERIDLRIARRRSGIAVEPVGKGIEVVIRG